MAKRKVPTCRQVGASILAYLDNIKNLGKRVERLDDLLHLLQCERRLFLLTQEEMAHMYGGLSPEDRKRIDEAKTEKEREQLIEMYARALYSRRCAWMDYLIGETPDKPLAPKFRGESGLIFFLA